MSEPKELTDLELMDAALIYSGCARPIKNLADRLEQRNREIITLKGRVAYLEGFRQGVEENKDLVK